MNSIVGVPHSLIEAHGCQGVVVTCMDFRFWEATLVGFAKLHLGLETFDVLIAPGCTRFLLREGDIFKDYFLTGIKLSVKLHKPQQLILVHHSTCGAYGIKDAATEEAHQRADMREARDMLSELFPKLRIRLFFASRHRRQEISYQEVQ